MLSRRGFVTSLAAPLLISPGLTQTMLAQPAEPVIDIHQHTNYSGRSDAELLAHQRDMGATMTVLLPAGSKYGLAVDAGGNDSVIAFAHKYPNAYRFFANELPDIPEARPVIEKYLKLGGIGIGEQKFGVNVDSPEIDRIAAIAREYAVPVLLHFEHNKYNLGFENFAKVVARHPRVTFIGHAQTWWGNIDRNHKAEDLYPKTPVTPGGLTDRLLSDYPNVYGDMSAGSGLNAMLRDEGHAREFLKRHQDKLMFGSDCSDRNARSGDCQGTKTLATIRRLASDKHVERKILFENASRLLKITV